MSKQGDRIELEITDLNQTGEGVGRYQGQVIFVPDTAPGDRLIARIVRVKRHYAEAKLLELLTPSPWRIRPRCLVADKCGGCQWQHLSDEYQSQTKFNQLVHTLERIGQVKNPPVLPLLPTGFPLGYRNKATYPLKRSETGTVQAGYYRPGSHQLINLNQCPVQDERLNPLLTEIKQDIGERGWSIYNEAKHQGKLRHLSLRIGRRTGEILLTLVSTDGELSNLEAQAQTWLERYPNLVGVALNVNASPTNVIFGPLTRTIAGKSYLSEVFAGLTYHLKADTFFQVNTEAAENLLGFIVEHLNLQGGETLLDAYCGIGTFTLPLARQIRHAYGIESQSEAIAQAQHNAQINQIENVTFCAAKVEEMLPQVDFPLDIVLLDPPRKGCHPQVLEQLIRLHPQQIVYVSCQGATLARDLQYLRQKGGYSLNLVQPSDFFPQTVHLECAAFLSQGDTEHDIM
jgi:23S rRNA (uracil1939-C5)-methyltransferase